MRRRIVVAATAAAVVVAGGGVAYAQAQGSSGSYRTAAVTVGDVDRTLTLSGTIAASARQDLSFGVSGTVTKVDVEVGDVVRSGATLATLDDTDLKTAVTKARATLAKAEAQLEADQDSQSSTVAAATTGDSGSSGAKAGSGSTPKPSSGGSTSVVSPQLKAALAALAKQQAAVTAAQTDATAAIAAAKSALATQTEACKAADETNPAEPTDGSADTGLSDECATALDAVQAAQDVVADRQETLQAALEALGTTLSGAVAELQKPSGSDAGSGSDTGSSSSGDSETPSANSSTGTTSGPSAGGTAGGGTVTAASLAQDQASIDTAKADLTEAKRNRDAADLTAPFSGKVLSVSATKGGTVAADEVMIVIVGNGDTTATTTVTADQVSQVKKGQTAEVTPAGATEAVAATVTSIGLLPDSSSETAAYPVTLDLSGSVAAPEGSTASIAVVVGTAEDVLTVPSSAVSTAGRATVSVLEDGKVVRTPVTVGVVGPRRTSITQGVKKGQEVVIADLGADLPSGGTTTTRFPSTGGFNGAPGGGPQPRAAG